MNDYYVILTPKGEDELLNSMINNTAFAPSYIAVGDSLGSYYEPSYQQTSLKNQTYQGEIYKQGKHIKESVQDMNYIFFDMQIPPSVGDFQIREVGLFNGNNELLAIAKYPLLNKLQSDSWMDRTVNIEIQIALSDSAINTIIINDSGNLATMDELNNYVLKTQLATPNTLGIVSVDDATIKVDSKGQIEADIDYITANSLNKTQITNCILDAPNGVGSIVDGEVELKQGLKVLIPNGRNADGSLKNIEYTLNSNVSTNFSRDTGTNFSAYFYVYLTKDGNAGDINVQYYFQGDYEPPSTIPFRHWIDTKNNITYASRNDSVLFQTWYALVGIAYVSNGVVASFTPFNNVELLKRTDSQEISSWAIPSDRHDDLILGVSGSTYTASAHGWFSVNYCPASNNSHFVKIINVTKNFTTSGCNGANNFSGESFGVLMPVEKQDVIQLFYRNAEFSGDINIGTGTHGFRFIYTVGSESEVY